MKFFKLAFVAIIFFPNLAQASGLNPRSCLDAQIQYSETGQYQADKINQCAAELDAQIKVLSDILLKHIPALSPDELQWYNNEVNSSSGDRLIKAQYSDLGVNYAYRNLASGLKLLHEAFSKHVAGDDFNANSRILYFAQALENIIKIMNPDKLDVLLKNESLKADLAAFLDCKQGCNVKDRLTGNFDFLGGSEVFLHVIQFDASNGRMKEANLGAGQ